jgi:hypothetical protein
MIKMYKIWNYLFGWDYILWKNCLYSGVSRLRLLPNGDAYFLTYGDTVLLNNITTGKGNGEVVTEWLTCDKSKYISEGSACY